MSTTVM